MDGGTVGATLEAEGWKGIDPDPFSRSLGQKWIHLDGAPKIGFVVGADQCNAQMGTVHGGALVTLADLAGGYAVAQAAGTHGCATVQLNVHFVAAARIGDFVVCQPEIVRTASQLIFVRGLVTVDERTVASIDGVWKVLTPRS